MERGRHARTGTAVDQNGLDQSLRAALDALAEPLPAGAAEQFADFLRLLAKWNRTWNLTAVRDPEEMVTRHLADSLSVRRWLAGDSIADVGSGAGLPGIPLAIAEPGRHFVLIDSAAKRTRFMVQAAATLGLDNVTVVHSRAQDYRRDTGFDTVISRAFASLADFAAAAGHLASPTGRLLAMKGRHPGEEIADLPAAWRAVEVTALRVPGLQAERHVVILNRASGANAEE